MSNPVILCGCFHIENGVRQYLPQVEVEAHTSVFATTSRTTLTQRYVNPGKAGIKEMRYVFPLYDGVSVVGFTCTIGDRVLTGVVKEKEQAKHEYKQAVESGQTAGLLEQSFNAGDVFTTSLGNVGPGEKVKVDITFIGELKHDAEVDGVRFMLPLSISPRYGSAPSLEGSNVTPKGISFTLDAEVPEGSAITAIRSPSHPISVSVGTTSTAPDDTPSLRKASATLSLGSVALGDDIIIQVVASNMGEPSAVVERHPTVDTQALMVTLVPKFSLPAEKPEIVFLCDRSGSMYNSIGDLKEALRIFLKSLPVGVKFNICSFGSNYSFLWSKSKAYTQQSLEEASKHIETFDANFGGTEMYDPMEATFKQRFKDMNLEVFLLTDGEIWNQDRLFELINKHVAESKGAIRVFTLGVGLGASTSLIEGVARAGNGFAQTTAHGEKMDKKVVRMLKGSLFPHITDYSLHVKYHKPGMSDDDDFELVEKISDALVISPDENDAQPATAATPVKNETDHAKTSPVKKIISLFQRDIKDDSTDLLNAKDKFAGDKYEHVPTIEAPRYLQTPTEIPALFPFNRTTAYVIINDRSSIPKSVILKGTSQAGPLELEIPVTQLKDEAATIHQLATRREMKELEEGRGWLSFAKDKDGKLLKNKYEGRFSDMTERECVRLGTTYQVAGKFTSLVALEKDGDKVKDVDADALLPSYETYVQPLPVMSFYSVGSANAASSNSVARGNAELDGAISKAKAPRRMEVVQTLAYGAPVPAAAPLLPKSRMFRTVARKSVGGRAPRFGAAAAAAPGGSGVLFGAAPPPPPPAPAPMSFGLMRRSSNSSPPAAQAAEASARDAIDRLLERGESLAHLEDKTTALAAASANFRQSAAFQKAEEEVMEAMVMPTPDEDSDDDMGFGHFDSASPSFSPTAPTLSPVASPAQPPANPLQELTALQTFMGSWSWSPKLQSVLGLGPDAASKLSLPAEAAANGGNNDILATACAIAYFKKKLRADKDAWEMMVEKAEDWLAGQLTDAAALLKAVEALF